MKHIRDKFDILTMRGTSLCGLPISSEDEDDFGDRNGAECPDCQRLFHARAAAYAGDGN